MTQKQLIRQALEALLQRMPDGGHGPSAWGWLAGVRERTGHVPVPPVRLPEGVKPASNYIWVNGTTSSVCTPILRGMVRDGLVQVLKPGKYARR